MRDILLNLILPPFGLFVFAASISLWAARGRARWWLTAFWAAVTALSTPVVADAILRLPLQSQPRFNVAVLPPGPLAVVVPMGGATLLADARPWPTSESARRAQHGHAIATSLGIPLVLSGGIPGALPLSEARITAEAMGLTAESVLLEEGSRDTCENAARSAALLQPLGITRVVAVTDATHLPRFLACLRHHGLDPLGEEAIALADRRGPPPSAWLPGNMGIAMLARGLEAHTGLAWYLVTGRFGWTDLWPDAN